jgi:hypothetical protein
MASSIDKAVQTQLENIQRKTGKSLDQLAALARSSGLTRHGEIRDLFKTTLGLGHGDANALVHAVQASDGTRAAEGKSAEAVLDEIYTGPKAALRPIHEQLMAEIGRLGDFETVPKKGYVSLRRRKQFAMIGPRTNTRFEVGLNAKDLGSHPRLVEQPRGGMCDYVVNLTDSGQVDAELISWIKAAFDAAG